MAKPHGKTSFQDSWFADPNFKIWLKKSLKDPYSAECSLCPGTKISIASMGRRALTSHMQGQKHKSKAEARNRSPGLLNMFLPSDKSRQPSSLEQSDTSSTGIGLPSTSLSGIGSKPTSSSCVSQASSSSCVSQPSSSSCMSPPSSSSCMSQPSSSLKKYMLNESVAKAEILWCIQTVMTHKSMNTAGKDVNVLKLMFPEHDVIKKLELQRLKIGYTVVFGLAPHFKSQLLAEIAKSKFVVSFDESLNKISQKQQMDIVIRFWDLNNEQVSTRYLTSAFLTGAKAVDLLNNFKSALEGVNMKNMVQVSMDGPNVNFAFLRELKSDLKESGQESEIIDFGSCGIHTVHNAFKSALMSTGWDLPRFLRAMYNLFKDVPARRGLYIRLTKSEIFPLKFCSIRWLENSAVAQRAIEVLPHLKTFVDQVVKEKCAPTSASFKIVEEFVKDPLIGPKLAFLKTLSTDAEPFLKDFQSNWPLAPLLHTGLSVLVDRLMERVVKSSERKISVDLKNDENLLHHHKILIGFSTQNEIGKAKKLPDEQISAFRKTCKAAVVAFITKLLEKSPLKYPVTRSFTSLDPAVALQELGKTRFDKLLQHLVNSGWISGALADSATSQYRDVCSTKKTSLESFKRKDQRLDDFWVHLLSGMEAEELKTVVKFVLILSHGNAEVERGFSVNKECLQDNMRESTLIGFRTVYDTVQKMGGIEKVPITKPLLQSAKNAYARYKESIEARRKAEKEENEEKENLKRKKKMIKELEEKRKKLIEDAKNEAVLLQNQISELEKK